MEKSEAIEVAKKYQWRSEKRREYRKAGDKVSAKYHEGCMMMALQIFEQFSETHGFGSPKHALGEL